MSLSTPTAVTITNGAATLLNDTAKVTYTFAVMLPYLVIALQELRELFEQNSVSVTQNTSEIIQMDAFKDTIEFEASPEPELPLAMVEPLQLWERLRNTDPWVPMKRVDYIPHSLEGPLVSQFRIFEWNGQAIKVLPSNQNNDIKIDFIEELFPSITSESSVIGVVNAITFLQYRTAALCAEFIERNMTSAQGLNSYAILAQDRALGISSKSKQTIQTRRRPFRSGWKNRRIII